MSADADDSKGHTPTAASSGGMLKSLKIVSLGTLVSRLLGLVRDVGMAALFGAGTILDTFVVAFRLPNLARQLFGEGAITIAFLPVFIRNQRQHGSEVARATLTATSITLVTLLSLLVIIAEVLLFVMLTWMTLTSATQLFVLLLMILLPYMVLICLSALLCAALHSFRQFLWPAFVPIVLNLIWMIGLLIAWKGMSDETNRIQFLAGVVTLAGVVQMIIPMVALHRMGMGFVWNWKAGWPYVADVFRTMVPVIGGLAVWQMGAVFDGLMAWGLAEPDQGGAAPSTALGIAPVLESGTAAALYYAQRLYQFPLGVFGVALGTVLYPMLTQHAQEKDWDRLRIDLTQGLRLVIAIAIPASVGMCLLAVPMTRVLFQRGKFDADDALLTSQIVAVYGAGVWSAISLAIINRAFYAIGDRMTPMRFGVLALLLNLLLNFLFLFGVGWGGVSLAIGAMLASASNVLLTVRKLNHRLGPFDHRQILGTFGKSLCATVLMVTACLAAMALFPSQEHGKSSVLSLVIPMGAGIVSYWMGAKLFRMPEIDQLLKRKTL